ncbi:MAG TPA: methyltransferase domain-containing protein [Gemmata sp.]|jgi:SAM-dependent methyltransferase|nr:methyltransferase domain-containing protein [Gemmata sp.]
MMRNYLLRLMHSPRWQFLRRWIGPYLLNGGPYEQWLRIVMNRETERLVHGLNPSRLSALEVSGDNWNKPGLFRQYRSVDYPEYDVCDGVLDERFDLILADQVFEHLLWPYRAGKNVYEMLNPGGWFLVSTPFLLKIHNHPVDCSRWTETGMKHLLAECGFPLEKVQTGSWGNRACVKANLKRWQIYQRWRHSLKNEPDFPVVVWALAQK